MGNDFLIELRETMTTHTIDALVAENIVKKIRKNWGGVPIYIKKASGVDSRNAEIYRRFNGKNHTDLCREFGLGYQQICKILNAERKKTKEP